MKEFFDGYTLRARVLPASIFVLPLFSTIATWYPAELQDSGLIVPTVFAGLILTALSHVVRSWGKNAEKLLFQNWGGMPSAIVLRHSDGTIDATSKQRYRGILASKIASVVMPSPSAELANPQVADRNYLTASQWLLANTRDATAFPLIQAENINYGFRRNMYGAKLPSIWLLTAIIMFNIVCCYVNWLQTGNFHLLGLGNLALCLAIMLFWIFIVRAVWVRETAFDFAKQLISACDNVKIQNA